MLSFLVTESLRCGLISQPKVQGKFVFPVAWNPMADVIPWFWKDLIDIFQKSAWYV